MYKCLDLSRANLQKGDENHRATEAVILFGMALGNDKNYLFSIRLRSCLIFEIND